MSLTTRINGKLIEVADARLLAGVLNIARHAALRSEFLEWLHAKEADRSRRAEEMKEAA